MGFNFNSIAIWLTCLTHFLIIAPTLYIVILCAGVNTSLFVWHPACFTVGCGLLMLEATLAISGEALLGSKVSRAGRIKIHWVLHAIGLVLITIGFGAIIANKIRSNSNHFVSDHAIVGLTAILLTFLVSLGGLMTLFSGLLHERISLNCIKLIHGCFGVIAIILMFAGLITGIYKAWWPGTSLGRSLTVTSYVLALFLVLIKPTYTTVLKIRGIFF